MWNVASILEGHAIIPHQPQHSPLMRESAGPACPWGIWITGNYFTFGLELFWQSSAVSFISSFLACKCPFYSSYSYRIYSSLFLKLLIPTSLFLSKSVPFHVLGIYHIMQNTYIQAVKSCVFLKLPHDAGLYYPVFNLQSDNYVLFAILPLKLMRSSTKCIIIFLCMLP